MQLLISIDPTMEQTHLFGLEEFQEQKVVNLYDSLSLTPTPKHLSFDRFRDEPMGENQLDRQELQVPTPKSGRHRRHSVGEQKNMNRGHWLIEENKKYHWFLQIHYKHFVNRHLRRMDKIFKTMETFIGTRQAQQCRSHHQKMEKKYHHFVSIISNLRVQHYDCEDIQPLVSEISANGIEIIDKLATIAELTEESLLPINNVQVKQRRRSVQQRSEQGQLQSMNPQIPQQEQKEGREVVSMMGEVQYHINILDESNLNIGELMLYHEKDDISGLFNFPKAFEE